MMDELSISRLQSVHPALDARVCFLVADFEAEVPGDTLIVAQGLRRWSDQEQLFLQGRNAKGEIVNPSLVVTNADAGHSWHEFGLAVDVVPRSLIRIPGWCPGSGLWAIITRLAEARGLSCGSCWIHKDLPHLQLTGRFGVSPDDEVRKLYLGNGGYLKAVWDAAGIPLE